MPHEIKATLMRYSWSAPAADLGLSDRIKESVALSLQQAKGCDETKKTDTLTIKDVWQVTAKYVAILMANESRDSDRLARDAARRGALPLPTLDIIADFPYGKLSCAQTERDMLTTLRGTAAKDLLSIERLVGGQGNMPELELIQACDMMLAESTFDLLAKSSSKIDLSWSKMTYAIAYSTKEGFFPFAYQHPSQRREEIDVLIKKYLLSGQ